MRLKNRVAFVTGASRGIGAAIARRFGAEGAKIVTASRDERSCRAVARKIVAKGGKAFATYLDVTDSDSVARAVEAAVRKWGRIDVLVNNAGMSGLTPLEGGNGDLWKQILEVNLTGVYRVTRACLAHIPVGGRIINLSSVVGRFGVAGYSAYSASKHGVIGLTRTWALELAGKRITVNAICPGWVETEMALKGITRLARARGVSVGEGKKIAARMAPLGQILEPEEIAALAAYIASDEARNLTGQAIVLDGGQVMP